MRTLDPAETARAASALAASWDSDEIRSLARGAATALLIGVGAAAAFEIATALGAGAAIDPTAGDGAHRWADLAPYQKLSVTGALATVAAVVVGAAALARKRSIARACAAEERLRQSRALRLAAAAGRVRRAAAAGPPPLAAAAAPPNVEAPSPSPSPTIEPVAEAEAIDLAAYLGEMAALARRVGPEAAPSRVERPICAREPSDGDAPADALWKDAYWRTATADETEPTDARRHVREPDDPLAWRTAHARRKRRFRQRTAGDALGFEAHETALRQRIVKLGQLETERRKSAENAARAQR